MKIPFDIKYKQDILDGKVKVVTRDNASVEIIRWDAKNEKYPLIGIVNCEDNEQPNSWTLEGATVFGGWDNGQDLFLLTPDQDLTEFEKCFIKEIEEVHGAVVPVDMEAVKESCGKLLELAKKKIADHYKVSSNYDGLAYAMGREEAMKGFPRWKPEPNGVAGGDKDMFLIRSSKGNYFTSSCIGGGNYYLELAELEKLPGLPKEV